MTAKYVPISELPSGLVVRRLSDVPAEPVRWLWASRIARGKLTLIAGHPGLSKSLLTLTIAATVTTGGAWPLSEGDADKGSVLILSAEDDAGDTIRPRLDAAGADLARCHIIDAVKEASGPGPRRERAFSLVHDLDQLANEIKRIGDVTTVIVDPISAYLGDTDSHRNSEMRGILALLAALAARHDVAVLAVSHLRKGVEGEAIQKVAGSLAFVAAARAAFIVARDSGDDARRLFLPIKNNLGNDTTGYAYAIAPVTLPDGIETCRIEWDSERVLVTADEALSPQTGEQRQTKPEMACGFLRDLLGAGPRPSTEIESEAHAAGMSWATVKRAAEELGIAAKKTGFAGGWEWHLPADVEPGADIEL